MKKNKGFTLVEIIAVVAVIAVLFLISFPSLMNVIKKKSDKEYEEFVNQLCSAGEYYILNLEEGLDQKLVSTGDQIEICLSTLNEEGLLKSSTINPNTNQKVDLQSSLIVTVDTDGTYSCTVEKKAYCTTTTP